MRKIIFQAEIENKQAQKQLDQLNKKIAKTEEQLNAQSDTKSAIEAQMDKANAAVEKTRDNLRRMQDELAAQKGTGVDTSALEARISGKKAELSENVRNAESLGKQYIRADEAVQKLTADLQQQQAAAGKLEQKIAATYNPAKLKEAASSVQASLKGGFKTILKYGLGIRSLYILFRKIRAIVTEGIKEVAQYDTATSKSLTNIKNGFSNVKASLISAFVPLVQVLEPILTRLMSILAKVIDYFGMYYAALTGQTTYKKAVAAQESYAASLKKTGKEAKKTTQYLSGLDEIRTYDTNKDESSASDSGSSGMITGVENVKIPETLLKAVGWIRDHLYDILNVAVAIGGVLLGWKLGTKLLPALSSLNSFLAGNWKQVAGLILVWGGLTLMIQGFWDAWKNGISDTNIVEYLAGLALVVVGLSLAFTPLIGGLAAIAGGIALVVLGIREWIKTGEITDGVIKAIVAGLLAIAAGCLLVGAAAAVLPIVILAAVVAIVLLIVKNWDLIKEKTEEIWGKIKDFFVTLWEVIKYLIELKIKQIKDKVVEIANNIVEKFKLVKTTVITLFEAIKSGVLQKIDNIKNGVTEKFNAIKDTISGVIDFVKRLFRGEIQFPHIKMPHFSWSWTDLGVVKIPNINVDWYARGGIVDKPTLIGAGEAGREAIVPLERNTEWIRRVADELADILTDRLGSILQSYPMPAVASGALIPPKIEVDIDGLDAIDSKLAAILDRMGSRGGSYSFTAQLNRKTLFQEVINEAKIAQSTTGRNPFELR